MAAPSCSVCKAATVEASAGGLTLHQCTECGLAFAPAEIGRRDYWAGTEDLAASEGFWLRSKRRYFAAVVALLSAETPGRRLLDVGGGLGFFAELASQGGWEAHTLDISPTVNALARNRLGSERVHSTFGEIGEPFDAVTLWCVLAHTFEFAQLLRRAYETLKPGGLLWVTSPNYRFQKPYASLRARLGKPIDFAHSDHLVHFTPAALLQALRNAGFDKSEFKYCGVTEQLVGTGVSHPGVIMAKRAWNRMGVTFASLGVGNPMSELQVLARRPVD